MLLWTDTIVLPPTPWPAGVQTQAREVLSITLWVQTIIAAEKVNAIMRPYIVDASVPEAAVLDAFPPYGEHPVPLC